MDEPCSNEVALFALWLWANAFKAVGELPKISSPRGRSGKPDREQTHLST